jgi:ATP-binding cassette subfamily B protein
VVGRTSLIIAHRLSTIRHATCIHVMEHGRIIESGSHDQLVARGGVYASLWRLQTGERAIAGD